MEPSNDTISYLCPSNTQQLVFDVPRSMPMTISPGFNVYSIGFVLRNRRLTESGQSPPKVPIRQQSISVELESRMDIDTVSDTVIRMLVQDVLEETKRWFGCGSLQK